MDLRKVIMSEPERCVACKNCMMACSLAHNGTLSPAQSRIAILNLHAMCLKIPILCAHCTEPLCVDVCPVEAISRDEATGTVTADSRACIGCRMCTVVCPLGAISIDYEIGKSIKCDLCGGDPACVKACGYGTLSFVPLDEDNAKRRRKAAEHISKAFEKLAE